MHHHTPAPDTEMKRDLTSDTLCGSRDQNRFGVVEIVSFHHFTAPAIRTGFNIATGLYEHVWNQYEPRYGLYYAQPCTQLFLKKAAKKAKNRLMVVDF
jgi:hypothetical protein